MEEEKEKEESESEREQKESRSDNVIGQWGSGRGQEAQQCSATPAQSVSLLSVYTVQPTAQQPGLGLGDHRDNWNYTGTTLELH